MHKELDIWGRRFDLEIIYDLYDGEELLEIQKEALEKFIEESPTLLSMHEELDEYCLKEAGDRIGEKVDNIFKYVVPAYLYVQRDEENRVVALFCDYKFDIEHGIALIYRNEKLEHIGPQDDAC